MLALCPETPVENTSAPLLFAFQGWMARPRARSIRNGWVCSGCVLSRDFRFGLLAISAAGPIQLRRLSSFGI